MKIIRKVIASQTRPPMMANHQLMNVKIFLSYPKRTNKRKRKKMNVPHQNRYSISHPDTGLGASLVEAPPPNRADPYDLRTLMEDAGDLLPPSSASSTTSNSSPPTSFSSSLQPGKIREKAGSMDLQSIFGDLDEDPGTSGMTAASHPFLNKAGKEKKRASPPVRHLEFSALADHPSAPPAAHPSGFHSDEQLGITVSEPSFSIMQINTSAMQACSYYVVLRGTGTLSVRLEISPDGKNFAVEEERELHPEEMIALSPRHVARFTRLHFKDQTNGRKRGVDSQYPITQLDVYFQYRL